MANFIGDIFSLNDVYDRQTTEVDSAVVEVQGVTGLTVTAWSGGPTSAVLTFAAQPVPPFPVGSIIAVRDAPTGFAGVFRVLACTTTTVTYNATNLAGNFSGTAPNGVSLITENIIKDDLWSNENTHGWVSTSGLNDATLQRVNFSNDTATASTRGLLSSNRNRNGAGGNSNYGWFVGGINPSGTPVRSSVDRVDFSNDSANTSLRGPLTAIKYDLVGASNSNYGWFGGGLPGFVTTVERIDFSNDSGSSFIRGSLTRGRTYLAATGNSNYGWFAGGNTAFTPTTIHSSILERIDFSNDSANASNRGSLNEDIASFAATSNSNYGWFGGGRTSPSPASFKSSVQRVDFSNDLVRPSIRGTLTASRPGLMATGNSNYGWFIGGSTGSQTRVERVDFSSDLVRASFRGLLASNATEQAATSGQAKSSSIRPLKGGNFGWWGGGFPPVTTVDRIDFSNDSSTASVRGPLSSARGYLAATGNSNYGWFGGGIVGAFSVSSVDRIDFSNDSSTASVRGPLSSARSALAATGNSNYGWFGGGQPTPTVSSTIVDRIDFFNDSSTTLIRGLFSTPRSIYLSATGNSNYGWFGGGFSPFTLSTVDRINFSNDSSIASVRGPLSLARYRLTATGNSNYGWFGGGGSPPVTTVDRIDFSNDSSTASVRGPLSSARGYLAATGNSNYGWFGGGYTGSISVTTVDRIDFSNDSATASVRGPLSSVNRNSAATSNTPVG